MKKKIISNADWTSTELSKNPEFIYIISPEDINELNTALELCKEIEYTNIQPSNFPLSNFAKKINQKFLHQLEHGIGCLLIRGLDIKKYSSVQLEQLFWGIGLHFGIAVPQTKTKKLLKKIQASKQNIDLSQETKNNPDSALAERFSYQDSTFKLWLHADPCDVTGLFCINQAKSGGENLLVSSIAIHNTMLNKYPSLLKELYKPYCHCPMDSGLRTLNPFYSQPIFSIEEGYFACSVLPWMIYLAQLSPNTPRMNKNQIEALDIFHKLAESSELCFRLHLKPGDMLFFNNYVILHGRQAFADHDDFEKKRLLLRLWLSVNNSRPLNESFRFQLGGVKAGELRGGFYSS